MHSGGAKGYNNIYTHVCDANQTLGCIRDVVYMLLQEIPSGRVTWYSHIAQIVSLIHTSNSNARSIGHILTSMNDSDQEKYPWYRVVAKNGYVSSLKLGTKGTKQVSLLQSEGVTVSNGYIAMDIYGFEISHYI